MTAGRTARPFAMALAVALVAPLGASGARPTIIHAGGEPWPGQTMGRIAARVPGSRGHSLQVRRASAIDSASPRPTGRCGSPIYEIAADAGLIELHVGRYNLTAKVALLEPPWSFEARGAVSVESGRCYEPALACKGDALNEEDCRVSLRRKRCAPLRSPRRIVLRPPIPC